MKCDFAKNRPKMFLKKPVCFKLNIFPIQTPVDTPVRQDAEDVALLARLDHKANQADTADQDYPVTRDIPDSPVDRQLSVKSQLTFPANRARMDLTDDLDQLDPLEIPVLPDSPVLRVRMATQVLPVHPDLPVLLAQVDQTGPQETQVDQVLTLKAPLEIKDQLVTPDPKELQVPLAAPVLMVLQASQVLEADQDPLATLERMVSLEKTVPLEDLARTEKRVSVPNIALLMVVFSLKMAITGNK